MDNSELRYKFLKFIEKLSFNTELRLILVLAEKDANGTDFQDRSIPMVSMSYMKKPEAIEFLKRIFYIENKTELVKGINLETHKVIDMWERMNFVDNEAFNISRGLSKRRNLTTIANDMEKKLKVNDNNDPAQQQVDRETSLSSLSVLQQMVSSSEKLLNDLIIFLTVCPYGLGLAEVQIVL